ncbi:MAG: chemotaxis protein CheW [bacterium]
MINDTEMVIYDEDKVNKILRERAKKLAIEPEQDVAIGDMLEMVEFHLSGERYAFSSRYIREVFPVKKLTTIPCTPPFVAGLTNLRGEMVSVIDLKYFFDLPPLELTSNTRIILLQNQDMSFGILADEVIGVYNIPTHHIQTILPTLSGIRAKYLHGVTEDRLAILEATAILNDPEIIVNEMV